MDLANLTALEHDRLEREDLLRQYNEQRFQFQTGLMLCNAGFDLRQLRYNVRGSVLRRRLRAIFRRFFGART